MITLEEAIKHCEEVAEKNEEECKNWAYGASQINDDVNRKKQYQKHAEMWHECAKEHRQLAKWLRELKKWRALRDSINMLCDVDCEYPQYRESKTMCDACPIGTVKEYFEQIFDEEVKVDG